MIQMNTTSKQKKQTPSADSDIDRRHINIDMRDRTMAEYMAYRDTDESIKSICLSYISHAHDLRIIKLFPNAKTITVNGDVESLDLSYIAHLHNIEVINLISLTSLREIDFSPLEHLSSIDVVRIAECENIHTIDLRGLQNSSILELCVNGTSIETIDMTPVVNEKLGTLSLFRNRLSDIDFEPLALFNNIHTINVCDNDIETLDLSPLRKCRGLRELSFERNPLKTLDVTPLLSHRELCIKADNDVIFSGYDFTDEELRERFSVTSFFDRDDV